MDVRALGSRTSAQKTLFSCAPSESNSESVKCRFSKCRFSVLNLKFDFISDGGCTREKQIQKALGSLPPCGNRCRFSESAICSSRVHPPSEIKSNFKFKTLRWRPLRWRLTLSEQFCSAEPWDQFCSLRESQLARNSGDNPV